MTKNIEFYCDGGARGNPGPAAIGVVIKINTKTIKTISQTIGDTTNNVAEYQALVAALQYCADQQQLQDHKIKVFMDALLVVKQVMGEYKIKSTHLKPLLAKVKFLTAKFALPVVFQTVPREQNKEADFLVNKALDSGMTGSRPNFGL